jgi:branched-chain amino acid transport system substrate-binding protein
MPTASTHAKDKAFRSKYAQAYKLQPDVYAVQGYDAAQLLAAGLEGAKGNGDSTRRR